MSTAVWIHALWMLAAVAVGTWSGYLGLLRATMKGGKSFLPGRYTLRVHRWTGTVYYAMLCVGIVYGFLMAEYILGVEPAGLWVWHERLAIAIGAIYFVGMVIGVYLLYRPAGRRRALPVAHMLANFTACTLIAVQILLALYASGWLR